MITLGRYRMAIIPESDRDPGWPPERKWGIYDTGTGEEVDCPFTKETAEREMLRMHCRDQLKLAMELLANVSSLL